MKRKLSEAFVKEVKTLKNERKGRKKNQAYL
jgi:hypothetical protein